MKRRFDESKISRQPRGTEKGGEFARKATAAETNQLKPATQLNMRSHVKGFSTTVTSKSTGKTHIRRRFVRDPWKPDTPPKR